MDLDNVETIDVHALGGADTITVNDLTGTDVTEVNLDLGANGVGDGSADTIILNATNGNDAITITNNNGVVTVTGLGAEVTITDFDANDRIVINGRGGDDVINGDRDFRGMQLTANGGDGDDILIGGAGNDMLNGEAGDDVLIGMAGRTSSTADPATTSFSPGLPPPRSRVPRCSVSSWHRASSRPAMAKAECRLRSSPRTSSRCSRSRTPDATSPLENFNEHRNQSCETDRSRPRSTCDVAASPGRCRRCRTDPASAGHRQDRHTGDAPVRQGSRTQGARLSNRLVAPRPYAAAGHRGLNDGGFLLVAKAAEDKVLVQSPLAPRPVLMTREELTAVWDGGLILMTRRAGLSDITRRFDITWFLGAIHKYRHLLSEVLLASFFLQMFGLVSPLFFQVVIDKVLVHRSLSTLDVLVLGLVAISVFETVLGILRTYLFAHTTNRIDVELGARLFHHLLALPMAYFQSRRVGDSVARVRELENIRNFLTSSALTLVIDLFFTFVFLAVMFFYSPLLTWIVLGSFPFYIAISAGATPLFRRRLDEKFRRGAENQAFLVESVTGIETLKAMAVEPQMQRRWEEQLAGYVAASFRVLSSATGRARPSSSSARSSPPASSISAPSW